MYLTDCCKADSNVKSIRSSINFHLSWATATLCSTLYFPATSAIDFFNQRCPCNLILLRMQCELRWVFTC